MKSPETFRVNNKDVFVLRIRRDQASVGSFNRDFDSTRYDIRANADKTPRSIVNSAGFMDGVSVPLKNDEMPFADRASIPEGFCSFKRSPIHPMSFKAVSGSGQAHSSVKPSNRHLQEELCGNPPSTDSTHNPRDNLLCAHARSYDLHTERRCSLTDDEIWHAYERESTRIREEKQRLEVRRSSLLVYRARLFCYFNRHASVKCCSHTLH